MSSPQDGALPEGFAGEVRLFPLPNLVLFPHALQPLHIFEFRYRRMLEDALADDQLLAMALLQPGWEAGYEGRPAIYPVTCIGRVLSHTRLEDGRYNILLQGLRRASVIRELPTEKPFRTAEVVALEDLYPPASETPRGELQTQLLWHYQRLMPKSAATNQLLSEFPETQLPLGVLTDIVAFAIQFEMAFKEKLLREWNVDLRAKILLERLASLAAGDESLEHPFPPDFSDN